jgi:hypothetical protein
MCLWYGADGHRLCEEHAQECRDRGETVFSPAVYAEAVNHTLEVRSAPPNEDAVTYQGSKQDVNALVSAVVALTALVSCCGGAYCLPLIAVLLGGAAYFSADKSFDPARTRRLAGIGIGTGALLLALLAISVGFYIVLLIIALFGGSSP